MCRKWRIQHWTPTARTGVCAASETGHRERGLRTVRSRRPLARSLHSTCRSPPACDHTPGQSEYRPIPMGLQSPLGAVFPPLRGAGRVRDAELTFVLMHSLARRSAARQQYRDFGPLPRRMPRNGERVSGSNPNTPPGLVLGGKLSSRLCVKSPAARSSGGLKVTEESRITKGRSPRSGP